MATSAGAVQLDLKANTKPFEKESEAAAGRVKGMFSNIGSMIGKAFAIGALVKFGHECTVLASRLTEVQNVVDQVFPNMNRRVDEWSQNLVEQFGLSETVAKRYVGTLGSMARGMGFTENQAYDMATSIAQLAGDVASFYDMSSDEAYDKLTSIFTGVTQPLRSLGINMTEATLDAYALAHGFERTYQEMGEAERTMLRFQFVSDRLKFAQGDFARTSNSWANQLRILSMRFDELKVAVGNSLIMALTPVIQVINTIIAALTRAANAFYSFMRMISSSIVGKAVGGLGKAWGSLTGTVDDAADSMSGLAAAEDAAAGSAGGAAAAQQRLNRALAGFDRITKLSDNSSSGGGGGGGGGGGAGGLDIGAMEEALDLGGGLADLFEGFEPPERLVEAFRHMSDALGHLAEVGKGALSWVWENVLKPLGEWTINEFAPPLIDALASAFDAIATALDGLYPIWDQLYQDVISPVLESLGTFLVESLEGWMIFFDWLKDVLQNYINPAIERALEFYREMKQESGKLGALGKSRALDPLQPRSPYDKTGFSYEAPTRRGIGGLLAVDIKNPIARKFVNILGKGKATVRLDVRSQGDTAKLAEEWAEIDDKDATLNAKVVGSKAVESFGEKVSGIRDRTVKIGYEYAGSKSDWQGDWENRLSVFHDKTPRISYEYTNTANAWRNQWENRLSVFRDHTAKITYDVRKTGINGIELNRSSIGDLIRFTVTQFAQGGWVDRNSPRLAIIGDNKHEGEIVSPESKFQTMLDKASANGGSREVVALLTQLVGIVSGMDTSTYLDGREITRAVVANINRQTQSTGRSPLII